MTIQDVRCEDTLNKLLDGNDSPSYLCKARCDCNIEGEVELKEVVLQEWWYEGVKVEEILTSAENYFYDAFDKHPFTVTNIENVKG